MSQRPLPESNERLHALDAVRGFALLLGVALHATLSYLPGAQYCWFVGDDASQVLARAAMLPGAALLLAIPTACALYFHAQWPMWFGVPTPDQSL